MTPDPLHEFIRRGQAAQRAVDALGAGVGYWWQVTVVARRRGSANQAREVHQVHAVDAQAATRQARHRMREAWPGFELEVVDVLQEGL